MTLPVAPPIRRVLALSILLCLVLFAWGLVVSPLNGLPRGRQAEINALSEDLDRLQSMTARKQGLEQRLTALHAQLAAEGGFWTGASAAAMAAGVQAHLRQVVTGSGGRVKSMSDAKESTGADFHQVTIRFSIEGTLDTVQRTLAAIDASKPALFVDGLTIAAPANVMPRERPSSLNLDLDVTGYMQAPRS